jgi:7-cyano-7-deazaguanine synthase
MKDTVLILSGGMDSTTLLHRFKEMIKIAIHFQYGQKHSKERFFAELNCEKLGIPIKIIDIENIGKCLKSDLLKNGDDIPEGHYEDKVMKKTVVPFRNGIMLAIACGIAESIKCKNVMIANHAGDHAIYPDCRSDFIFAMGQAMSNGTYQGINLYAPFTRSTKRDVALIGKEMGVDYNNTWSCYQGGEKHCGKCGTCIERKEALKGFDNTKYEE